VKKERKIVRQLGKQIRALREARGWSQEELAIEAGVDSSHLGKLERGEGNPTIELIVRVAQTLGADVVVKIEERI
jgi:XRE family transcriptional regulator, regulator of sulfur utilization